MITTKKLFTRTEVFKKAASMIPESFPIKEKATQSTYKRLIKTFKSFEHMVDEHRKELIFCRLLHEVYFDPIECVYYMEKVKYLIKKPNRAQFNQDGFRMFDLDCWRICDFYGENNRIREERYKRIKDWWPKRHKIYFEDVI